MAWPASGIAWLHAHRIEGDVPGLKAKWKHGYGRWVRDILIWTKTPFLFRNELVPADALAGEARPVRCTKPTLGG